MHLGYGGALWAPWAGQGRYQLTDAFLCVPLLGTCEASRFDLNRRSDSIRKSWADSKIGRACPLLVVVKRLKPLTVLSGTVYRLASSMSDHTPVLFNVFEDWNEESVVPHISFDSIRIWFERKRRIRRSLTIMYMPLNGAPFMTVLLCFVLSFSCEKVFLEDVSQV